MRAGTQVIGRPTRGTTGTNRLRRVDRWIAQLPALRAALRENATARAAGAARADVLEAPQLAALQQQLSGLLVVHHYLQSVSEFIVSRLTYPSN